MNLMLDSFWRAAAYCMHPRVIALSFLPLVIMVGLALGLGYFFWEPAMDWVRVSLNAVSLMSTFWNWLQNMGMGNLKTVLVPLIVIFAVTPVVVILSLLLVAMMMTPAMVTLVAERRFPTLERKKGDSLAVSVAWSLGSTLLAVFVLILTIPLWLVPPLILVLPPLIWGWLTYRVMSFDALADHASKDERREIMRKHRGPLLVIGIITGYLGAAPSLVWASGALFAAAIGGVRSGTPGKPFPFDLEMKAHAEEQLATVGRLDPAFALYTNLLEHAKYGIARQLREGQQMDEEDAAAA